MESVKQWFTSTGKLIDNFNGVAGKLSPPEETPTEIQVDGKELEKESKQATFSEKTKIDEQQRERLVNQANKILQDIAVSF